MLETNKQIKTDVSMDIFGKSVVDDKIVARYLAHINSNEGRIDINVAIYDEEKYKSDCQNDESEFENDVFDSQKQIMDKQEDIAGLFQNNESDNTDNTDNTDNPDDNDDDSGMGGNVSAGDGETIIP